MLDIAKNEKTCDDWKDLKERQDKEFDAIKKEEIKKNERKKFLQLKLRTKTKTKTTCNNFFKDIDLARHKEYNDPKFLNNANQTLFTTIKLLKNVFDKSKCTPFDCISTIMNRNDDRFYQTHVKTQIDRSQLPPCLKHNMRIRMQKYFLNINDIIKKRPSNNNNLNFKQMDSYDQKNMDYKIQMDPIGQ